MRTGAQTSSGRAALGLSGAVRGTQDASYGPRPDLRQIGGYTDIVEGGGGGWARRVHIAPLNDTRAARNRQSLPATDRGPARLRGTLAPEGAGGGRRGGFWRGGRLRLLQGGSGLAMHGLMQQRMWMDCGGSHGRSRPRIVCGCRVHVLHRDSGPAPRLRVSRPSPPAHGGEHRPFTLRYSPWTPLPPPPRAVPAARPPSAVTAVTRRPPSAVIAVTADGSLTARLRRRRRDERRATRRRNVPAAASAHRSSAPPPCHRSSRQLALSRTPPGPGPGPSRGPQARAGAGRGAPARGPEDCPAREVGDRREGGRAGWRGGGRGRKGRGGGRDGAGERASGCEL